MSIKVNDVKKLWGNAGGKCSICKVELSPIDSHSILGEMAHIIAQSPNGPRGSQKLSTSGRDQYENLILLCPNHHKTIDNDFTKWTIDKLKKTKAEHELWVNERLEQGTLVPTHLDSPDFIKSRSLYWENKDDHRWSLITLTPLKIQDDTIEPITDHFKEAIQNLQLPKQLNQNINASLTEPSVNGLINEDFRRVATGSGHRFELWRNGHIEFVLCLDFLFKSYQDSKPKSQEDLRQIRADEPRLIFPKKLIPYGYFAKAIISQLKNILEFWQNSELPFNDMLISVVLIGFKDTSIVCPGGTYTGLREGRAAETNKITHSTVINRVISHEELIDIIVIRIVNSFGFELQNVLYPNGLLMTPE